MTRRLRQVTFWLLLAAFVGLAAAYSLYFPYSPEALYRAIPGHAAVITEHEQLAARWKEMLSNPLARGLLRNAGFTELGLNRLVRDPGTQAILDRFAARHTVLAYVPVYSGRSGQPGWVFATWAGPQAQLLRWGVYSGSLRGMRKVRLASGRRIWSMEAGPTAPGQHFSMVAAEGLLLGCLSSDPQGVEYVLHRVERRARVPAAMRTGLGSGDSIPGAVRTPDRGWARWHGSGPGDFRARDLQFGWTLDGPGAYAGWLHGNFGLASASATNSPASGGTNRVAAIRRLATVLRNAPATLVVLPLSYVLQALPQAAEGSVLQWARAQLQQNAPPDALAFLCLCDLNHSSRIAGFRAPTLLAGVEIADAAKVPDLVSGLLDRLNAKYGWGLIPAADPQSEAGLIAVNGVTRRKLPLGAGERPSVAVRSGWLLIASGRDALSALLRESTQGAVAVPWLEDAVGWEADAYGWSSIGASGDALAKALALYNLMAFTQEPKTAAATRRQAAQITGWVNTLRPSESATAWLNASPDGFSARFRLGPRRNSGAPAEQASAM